MKEEHDFYQVSGLYERVFPLSEEARSLFNHYLSHRKCVLDLGCGRNTLALTCSVDVVGIDLERGLLRGSPSGICGDMFSLPFASNSFDASVSQHLSVAYAHGNRPDDGHALAKEVSRVLTKNAMVLWELPIAHKPTRLQGMRESAQLAQDLNYEFLYHMVLEETSFGAVLDSEIRVCQGEQVYTTRSPIHVYTPDGIREMLYMAGMDVCGFLPCYELVEPIATPPKDTMLAMVLAYRKSPGGGGAAAPSMVFSG